MRFSDVREAAPDPLGGPSFPIARHIGVVYTFDNGVDPVLSDFGFVGYPPTEYQVWAAQPPTQPRLTWTVPDVGLGYVKIDATAPVGPLPPGVFTGDAVIWWSNTNLGSTATGAYVIRGTSVFIPRSAYLWITKPSVEGQLGALPTGSGTASPGGINFVGGIIITTIPVTPAFTSYLVFSPNSITGFRLYRSPSAFLTAAGTPDGTLIADETVLSHTTTSAGFVVPSQGSNVTVSLTSAAWISSSSSVLKHLIVVGAGVFQIVSIAGNSVTLTYLVNAVGTFTRYNTHSGTTINSGANVIPASYSDTLSPSPELNYRLVGLSTQFNYPNNDVNVGVQGSYQDFGIDWVGAGLPEGLGLTALSGVSGLANITIRHTTCVEGFDWENFGQLVTASFPNLTSCGFNFIINGASNFTTLSLPVFVPANGQTLDFSSNALNAASVNLVLARCVAASGYVSGSVALNGGTNSAPTGQGVTDKATLQARIGASNVLTN